ncbi:MAG: cation/multidrug efflux pump [Cellvibrionaceae bacterium]
MFYSALAIGAVLIGVLVVLASLKVLARSGWFLGWLRGMFGLVLITVGIFFAFSALDIYSYEQVVEEQVVATVSFEEIAPQRYKATLVDKKGNETRYELAGDQWQLDARMLKWPNSLSAAGIKPGYRLDRISGRYYSLEEERSSERTVYSLNKSQFGVDIWAIFNGFGRSSIVDAVYGSATFVPMSDGALYDVRLSNTGLLARPLNDMAQNAVNRWE